MASDPALILNYKSKAADIPTINLTRQEAILHYPLLRGNIAQDLKDNLDASTVAPGRSIHQHAVHDESFSSIVPSHTGLGGAPAVPSTLVLQNIPTDSLVIDKKAFSPKSIDRVKALMSKENRTQTLIKVGTQEAATHFNAPTSQDKKSYDGDISEVDEEDAEVIPNEEDDAQMENSKPVGMTCFQTMKAKKRPTRRMATKLQSLQTRNQFENVATGHHLDLEMVQIVMTRTFSLQIERPNIPRTTFPFTASREMAGYFS